MKKMLVIGGGVLLAGIAGTFAFLYFTKEPPPVEPDVAAAIAVEPPETYYFPITPEFIVNFKEQSAAQFLMVDVTVASLDSKVPDVLNKHMAELRNDMLLLFSDNATQDLFSDVGKAALRDSASATITAVLKKHYEDGEITDLFFTRFVMQ